MTNINIKELKENASINSVVLEVIESLMMSQHRFMNMKMDDDGNVLKDENDDYIYSAPNKEDDEYDWVRYTAYDRAIQAVAKIIK